MGRSRTRVSRCTDDIGPLRRLPLVTLYLTERCNSRCVTCDYWRTGRTEMSMECVRNLLPSLERLGTQWVMLSGGEPLMHPSWASIAQLLKAKGLELGLLTSGLFLAKHAHRAAELLDDVTVSLDGVDRRSYATIRGVDAFDAVCRGVRSIVSLGVRPSLRVTLQRGNYRHLLEFIVLAKSLGAARVSFLGVDTSNTRAFGRSAEIDGGPSLQVQDLDVLERLISTAERDLGDDFRSGFIAESPVKLRAILQRFAAAVGRGEPPVNHCNAPEFSAVVDASGRVQPCFFIPGPASVTAARPDLTDALNADGMRALRSDIREGRRAECRTCVCTLWRDTAGLLPFRPNAPGARVAGRA